MKKDDMDWTLAMNRNQRVLLRVIAQLFALSGLAADGSVVEMPRHLRSRVLRLLLPASAARDRVGGEAGPSHHACSFLMAMTR